MPTEDKSEEAAEKNQATGVKAMEQEITALRSSAVAPNSTIVPGPSAAGAPKITDIAL